MSEAIKLFGKMIALPDHLNKEETTTASKDREEESQKSDEEEKKDDSSSNSQEKTTLKKPDKILPCPRCNSLDTKFCYFNNYNVNQPRHFCKNCQRYWTAGGTMRNVPVGAGRRKNKTSVPSSTHYRHISDANGTNPPNGTVLSFGRMEEQSCRGSSVTVANSNEDGFAPPVCPFPYMSSASSFPMPFYPAAAYWVSVSPTATTTLGKHRREPEIDATNSLWFPKTLRIGEPEEASKSSSIWANVGFKSFQKKGEVRAHYLTEASQALHANPAALSRAIRFQESSV